MIVSTVAKQSAGHVREMAIGNGRDRGYTRASFVMASYTVKSDNRKESYSFGGRQVGREKQKGK